jgi:hypothetical protein
MMIPRSENPGALADARRVDVTMLASKNDFDDSIATPVELQVRKLLTRYALSLPVASAVAEIAFGPRRGA